MSTITGSIYPDDTLLLAARRMRDINLGCVTVCDDTSGVVGVVTDRDITLHVANGGNPRVDTVRAVPANQVLITIRRDTRDPIFFAYSATLEESSSDHTPRRCGHLQGEAVRGDMA